MAKVVVIPRGKKSTDRQLVGPKGVVYIDHVTDEDKQVIAPQLKMLGKCHLRDPFVWERKSLMMNSGEVVVFLSKMVVVLIWARKEVVQSQIGLSLFGDRWLIVLLSF